MTGLEVVQLRTRLGINTQQLASLLGVHPTTVYRWENQMDQTLRLEQLQHGLLLRLQERARTQEPKSLGQQLVEGLVVGGTLVGLALLLSDLINPTKPRR